jgi:transposase
MAREFVGVQRGQLLLMPPSLSEWLPEDHLVWTVLGAVEQMDLERFARRYRLGGAGRAPFDPAMLVALLLYAYARGIRSSRQIERACHEDVAFKVIAGLATPDHSTVAEFRRRHEFEIAELFDDVLGLCREAGLVSVGVIAIDGTKITANASMDQNRSYRQIATEILREADEVDRREDELHGSARGDELPEALRTPDGRRAALEAAKRRIAERRGRAVEAEEMPDTELVIDPQSSVSGSQGRREWDRAGRRQLDRHRENERRPIPNERTERLFEAVRRLEQNEAVDLAVDAIYTRWRVDARDRMGRRLAGIPKRYERPEVPDGRINVTDPDSRVMRTLGTPARQAYNAQAAVTEQQIIVAAEITVDSPDFGHLEPMVKATLDQLQRDGITQPVETVLADAGYWHTRQMQSITARGIKVLVPPDSSLRDGKRPGWTDGPYDEMREVLASETGRATYRLRQTMIEPVYGQIKHNRGITRLMRRGRAAAQSEWRLITATHNLLKLHSHWVANIA